MSTKKPATERLAEAMIEAGCPAEMIQLARDGYYDDYKSPEATPCINLVNALTAYPELRKRAMLGEFDAAKWESDIWAKSPEGQAVMKLFPPELRKQLFGV